MKIIYQKMVLCTKFKTKQKPLPTVRKWPSGSPCGVYMKPRWESVFGLASCFYHVSYTNISKPTKSETPNKHFWPQAFQIKDAGSIFAYALSRRQAWQHLLDRLGNFEALTPEAFVWLQIFQGKAKVPQAPLVGTTVGPNYFPENDKCSWQLHISVYTWLQYVC